jgi:hypothetical protein
VKVWRGEIIAAYAIKSELKNEPGNKHHPTSSTAWLILNSLSPALYRTHQKVEGQVMQKNLWIKRQTKK